MRQNRLTAGASPRTPLGELTALPQIPLLHVWRGLAAPSPRTLLPLSALRASITRPFGPRTCPPPMLSTDRRHCSRTCFFRENGLTILMQFVCIYVAESPCSSHPCLNDGTCVTLSMNSYWCECDSLFFGENCEFLGPGWFRRKDMAER